MIATISFTNILELAAVSFGIGMIVGGFTMVKLFGGKKG